MATSIVCYSNTGNNDLLAHHLADRLQCGVVPIVERHRRHWLRTVLDLTFGWAPPIEPLPAPLSAYQHVILVGPVWASRLASPLRTFIAEHAPELGEYSFVSLCGYASPEQQRRLTEELTRRVGHPPRAVCQLPIAELFPRPERDDARRILPYRVSEDDLTEYEPRVEAFLAAAGVHRSGLELAASAE